MEWNNRDWTANISHVDSFEKRTFLPVPNREYQIRYARFGSSTWRVRFELTSIGANNETQASVIFPQGAADKSIAPSSLGSTEGNVTGTKAMPTPRIHAQSRRPSTSLARLVIRLGRNLQRLAKFSTHFLKIDPKLQAFIEMSYSM